ncbi:DUF421 domain-containing protein [Dyadobacter subterraneus]|uniref:DUF421 domain-containing protein n=1 Tax=Dyadobacter subterraneus TaxID=2773304 RepID=A0ABR9WDF1_9BACT|nr:YetF domain-containing protein [Dyadobacter subterraneus]MBE9463450.1 DUF421 domain-containing protein [Dyadobacter subterraneus]
MKKEDIHIGDWDRILFGEGPPAYLLEVVVRVALVYLLIFISIRFMGKRLIAEMARADLVARVSLAAAVGLAIQRPGRGILVSAVIVMVIIFVGRLLAVLVFKNRHFESAFQGKYSTLVNDGVIDIKLINKLLITKERLFAALREENIRHLGQVQRFYMEADGKFSLVSQENPAPGLSIIPEWDPGLRESQQKSDTQLCSTCGTLQTTNPIVCIHCGNNHWEPAIYLPKKVD